METMTRYDQAFYRLEEEVALRSARHVMPWALSETGAESVIDVGCGTGGWLSVAKEQGARVCGMDSYNGKHLLAADEFVQCDIANGVKCGGYDLALCLEVAEHLDRRRADAVVGFRIAEVPPFVLHIELIEDGENYVITMRVGLLCQQLYAEGWANA
jgi:ribosomal protein L11 methylase PrmA